MESVAWITLCGVLVGGWVCLRLCRGILQSPMTGGALMAAGGFPQVARITHPNSSASGWVVLMPSGEFIFIPASSTPRARFPGWVEVVQPLQLSIDRTS